MAEDLGLTYRVKVDDGDFVGTFKDLNGYLYNTRNELKALEKALKIDPNNVELLTKKASALEKAIALNSEKARKFEKDLEALQKADFIDQKKISRVKAELEKVNAELLDMNTQKKKVEKIDVKVDVDKNGVNSLGNLKGIFSSLSGINIPDFSEFKTASGSMSGLAVGAGLAAGAVAGLAWAGKEAWQNFLVVDDVTDKISNLTGQSQKALDIFDKLSTTNPDSLEQTGEAVLATYRNFKKLSEVDLAVVTDNIASFTRYLGGDVNENADILKRTMLSFKKEINLDNINGAMGLLATKIQESSINAGDFMTAFDDIAPTLAVAGFSIEETASLVSILAQNGLDASDMTGALNKAMTTVAEGGAPNIREALNQSIESIRNASTDTDALNAATELFGAKKAPAMVDAIKNQGFSLDDLTKEGGSIETYKTKVDEMNKANEDTAEAMDILGNKWKAKWAEVGNAAADAILKVLEYNAMLKEKGVTSPSIRAYGIGIYGEENAAFEGQYYDLNHSLPTMEALEGYYSGLNIEQRGSGAGSTYYNNSTKTYRPNINVNVNGAGNPSEVSEAVWQKIDKELGRMI